MWGVWPRWLGGLRGGVQYLSICFVNSLLLD